MANLNEVKGEFEWQGRSWKAYWNGKDYKGTKYVTATSPTGSQVKISYNPDRAHPVDVSTVYSKEMAVASLKSIGIEA